VGFGSPVEIGVVPFVPIGLSVCCKAAKTPHASQAPRPIGILRKIYDWAEGGALGARVSLEVFAFSDYSALVARPRESGFVTGVIQEQNIAFAVGLHV
jgi:hypothetical protein